MIRTPIDTIDLDLDDTLVEFTEAVCENFTGSRDISGVTDYSGSLFEICGCTPEDFYRLMANPWFWQALKFSALGIEILDAAIRSQRELVIMTAIPHATEGVGSEMLLAAQRGAMRGKLDWFNARNYGAHISLALVTEKWRLAAPGKLLIDDNPTRVENFIAHGGQAITVPKPWNDETRCPLAQLSDLLDGHADETDLEGITPDAQILEAYGDMIELSLDIEADYHPSAKVVKMPLASQEQTDFRDSYLAALAGGGNSHVAETRALNSVKVFRARRTKSDDSD